MGSRRAQGLQLGVSPAMQKISAMLPRLAEHAATVLITGESGVGKDRVALQLHGLAAKGQGQPFVAVNCGAITETLIEAELFGHEKGAFTGAIKQQAQGGTLFLDEIGDMPLGMQVKLLRAIQERRIVRVGGETPVAVETRIICATNQDLRARVEAGTFREDPYYRINVIHLRIPPLRERPQGIAWFARQFLDEFRVAHGGERRTLSPGSARRVSVLRMECPPRGHQFEEASVIEGSGLAGHCPWKLTSAGPSTMSQSLVSRAPTDVRQLTRHSGRTPAHMTNGRFRPALSIGR